MPMSFLYTHLILALYLVSGTLASELVLYWGQGANEQSLGDYCKQNGGDVYVMSFLNQFGGSNKPSLNLGNHCQETFSGSTLLNCPDVGSDIKACQAAGKKVLLSMGGAVGQYGFTSDDDAKQTAQDLWNMFGGGQADQRPFGDAKVDGFDLDIENNKPTGYAALVNELRNQFSSDSSKQYFVSAAPQCVYPDASVGDALKNSNIDYAFIQFYNNPCSLSGQFNWDTWQDYAQNTSPNKNIKLFLGLPASTSAAGSGYETPDTVQQTVSKISSSPNFGGIMLWDAGRAYSNEINGESFAVAMKNMLGGDSSSPSGSPSTSPSGASSIGSGSSSPSNTPAPSGASSAGPVSSGVPPAGSAPAGPGSPGAPPAGSAPASPAPSGSAPAGQGSSGAPTAAGSGVSPAPSGAVPGPSEGPESSYNGVGRDVEASISTVPADDSTSTVTQEDTTTYTISQIQTVTVSSGVNSVLSVGNKAVNNTVSTENAPASSSTVTPPPSTSAATAAAAIPPGVTTTVDSGTDGQNCDLEGKTSCIEGGYAVCNYGKWVVQGCAQGTTCNVNDQGQAYCGWPKRGLDAEHHAHVGYIRSLKL